MNTIPQTDPKAGYLAQAAEIEAAIRRVLESGWYILGKEVAAFEAEFAAFVGARHGIGVANGTDALIVGLRALGVGPGDGAVTVSHTAVATVAAIELVGATPILVDIDQGYGMDADELAAVLKSAPVPIKAIIPVHLYGQPVALDRIMPLAERHGVAVLEDCSQAHGATFGAGQVGTFGRLAAYSLYPTKNLGALGDGGVLVTNDAAIDASLRALREYGWRERYISSSTGQNTRLDEMQAAILRIKLHDLDADNARRRAIAARYRAGLAGSSLRVLETHAEAEPVYHLFVVETAQRAGLLAHLKTQGVLGGIHYALPVHTMDPWRPDTAVALPNTERACAHVASLPMYPELTDAEVDRVIAAVRGFTP